MFFESRCILHHLQSIQIIIYRAFELQWNVQDVGNQTTFLQTKLLLRKF